MGMETFLQSGWFQWVVLPLLIFVARILDVTLMTLRIVFSAQGRRSIAPIVGFFEVLIWILAISQIMRNLTNPLTYIAYAAGFAAGNYMGLFIEQKLAMGMVAVRVFLKHDCDRLMNLLEGKRLWGDKIIGDGNTRLNRDNLYANSATQFKAGGGLDPSD